MGKPCYHVLLSPIPTMSRKRVVRVGGGEEEWVRGTEDERGYG